jgi:hypothetical protein
LDFNKQRAVNHRPTFKPLNTQNMLYVRTPLHGNEYKVCDEITDEVVAIFFNQQDAIDYINWKTNKQEIF